MIYLLKILLLWLKFLTLIIWSTKPKQWKKNESILNFDFKIIIYLKKKDQYAKNVYVTLYYLNSNFILLSNYLKHI